jgi:hypothetical protein
MQYVHALACDVTGRCMQLLHGLCCFGFCLGYTHRHLSNIDCLKARTACLVCFISLLMATAKKEKEKEALKDGASSGHITNLKQSILDFQYLWCQYRNNIKYNSNLFKIQTLKS